MGYIFGNQCGVMTVNDERTVGQPKEIRFINSNYDLLFKIPDGGYVEIKYKDGRIKAYEQKLKEAGYTVVLRDFNEFHADRQATPEPDKDIPTEEHIFLDSTREELYWIYYNPDSDAGGQLVTNTLSFSVFREAYKTPCGRVDISDVIRRKKEARAAQAQAAKGLPAKDLPLPKKDKKER